MSTKLRNAYLRGWFAARARRPLPATDGLAEKCFLDHGFDAGASSTGSALTPLAPVNARDLRAAWEKEFEMGKSRLQQRYLNLSLPGAGPAPKDSPEPRTAETTPPADTPTPKSGPPTVRRIRYRD